ncbi:MAG: type II toxin-antitoxin system HicA family toxin [Firmicutes bacterium]|nr:type II toxin-antitoxin system HicA family toxin [Bacillota bacterium]
MCSIRSVTASCPSRPFAAKPSGSYRTVTDPSSSGNSTYVFPRGLAASSIAQYRAPSGYTFNDFRKGISRLGSVPVRHKGRHEVWRHVDEQGRVQTVCISRKHNDEIPRSLLHEMLRRASLTKDEFARALE